MASETVNQSEALKAFEGYEQGVFLEWMTALSDMMMCNNVRPSDLLPGTIPAFGGLMFALTQAAQELGERDRKVLLTAANGERL